MKKIVFFFILAIIIALSSCQKQKLTCTITSPSDGKSVLLGKNLTVRIEATDPKSSIADVTVSYSNTLSSLAPETVVLYSEPYAFTIPSTKLRLGEYTIHAVATNMEGDQAESSVTIKVVEDTGGGNAESPNFVTFSNGQLPAGWMTYTWDMADIGYDDNYSLVTANSLATVYTKKTMNTDGYVEFYTKGGNVDLYIDDEKANAHSSQNVDGGWKKWVYFVSEGKHTYRWQAEGTLKYLDAITFRR